MRQPARRRPSHTSRSPRHRPAQAHAPCRARAADPRAQRLTSTPPQKCSGDFFAKALISLGPPPEFAQVGLNFAKDKPRLQMGPVHEVLMAYLFEACGYPPEK